MTYTAYVLRRIPDGMFFQGGSRWKDGPNAIADHGVCTRAMQTDIKKNNKYD